MLLEAKGLTRYYGDLRAVNDVSFCLDRGEIVGLLGPNGAGKSTTMRMLTSFLPPSSGTTTIAGYNVTQSPLKARHHIGYMPENNPLYAEMRCMEYLQFRAELKGLRRNTRTDRISRCMGMCGITEKRRQIIDTLSKGYRQRVGLADALLSNPDVLILDEPTIGLDPNQIRQTRDVICQLGENHTILVSTHILQEVEAICERALIIDHGEIVADDRVDRLSATDQKTPVYAEIQGNPESVRSALSGLERVEGVTIEVDDGWCCCTIEPIGEDDLRSAIFEAASSNNWNVRELTRQPPKLEEIFHRLTTRDVE